MGIAFMEAFLQKKQTYRHYQLTIGAGQIIVTSHNLGPQKVAEEGNPLISGKSNFCEIL